MIRGVARFLADFVIGDDWRIAAGVTSVLAIGALLVAHSGLGDGLIAVLVALGFVAIAALTLRD
jgi:hypothetical protein